MYKSHNKKTQTPHAGADPGGGRWGARLPLALGRSFTIQMHYSIAFKHQSITGRPPLGEIPYPPLTRTAIYDVFCFDPIFHPFCRADFSTGFSSCERRQ